MAQSRSPADTDRPNRNGLWLVLALGAILLVADFFYGTFTQPLLLGQGSVTAASDPAGARVFADTQELGVTPLESAMLLPGDYVLRIEHPHFEPWRESITLARGDRIERAPVLKPAKGNLMLVSNPKGAAIRLNGEPQSEVTPALLENRQAGIYDVELRIEGRKTASQRLDVQRNQTAEMNADLNRVPMGRLTLVLSPEDARVEFLDSELTYVPDMPLPLGDYRIRVRRNGFSEAKHELKIRRGLNRHTVELAQQFGELQIKVTPAAASAARVNVRANGRTLNYSEPVLLPTGELRVSASLPGYRALSKTLQLGVEGASVELNLEPYRVTPGRVFRDSLRTGGEGPAVVVIDRGAFDMGDLSGQGSADERPAHKVQLRAPFAIGVREVSVGEWSLQFAGVKAKAKEESASLPKTSVSREQIEGYLKWLSTSTGERYRLPSEAQWEYAARGATQHVYGVTAKLPEVCTYANVADLSLRQSYANWDLLACDDGHAKLSGVGSLAPNSFGIFDIIGNAGEWVADCWHPNYSGAPTDERVWGSRCPAWVSRGGSWNTQVGDLRVSYRKRVTQPSADIGFRVLREL